jgi:predicted O-methyltransferase YrrM
MPFGGLSATVRNLLRPSEAQKNAAQSSEVSLDDMKRIEHDIIRFLLPRGRLLTEGSSSREEMLSLATTVQRTKARLVGEIGFNVGFSSHAFLTADPETRVISFDLGEHGGTKVGKRLVDKRYPGRHTLIYGDSTETVPKFASENPDLRFDIAFIDGGHDYEVARTDILNMKALCSEKTVVIIDDLTPWHSWGKGPTQAWTEAIQEGIIEQDALFKDGKPIDALEPPGKRVWALGRYVFGNSAD